MCIGAFTGEFDSYYRRAGGFGARTQFLSWPWPHPLGGCRLDAAGSLLFAIEGGNEVSLAAWPQRHHERSGTAYATGTFVRWDPQQGRARRTASQSSRGLRLGRAGWRDLPPPRRIRGPLRRSSAAYPLPARCFGRKRVPTSGLKKGQLYCGIRCSVAARRSLAMLRNSRPRICVTAAMAVPIPLRICDWVRESWFVIRKETDCSARADNVNRAG